MLELLGVKLVQLIFGIVCIVSLIGYIIKTFLNKGVRSGIFTIISIPIFLVLGFCVLGFIILPPFVLIFDHENINITITLLVFFLLSIVSLCFLIYQNKRYIWDSGKRNKRIFLGILSNILISCHVNFIVNENCEMIIFSIIGTIAAIYYIYVYNRMDFFD
jgi:hypothetical protein